LAKQIPAEDLQLYYQTAILGRRDLVLAPDTRTGFRMTLIRMLAFRPPQAGAPAMNPAAPAAAPVMRSNPGVSSVASPPNPPNPPNPPTASAVVQASISPPVGAPQPDERAANGPEQEWSALVAALDVSAGARQLAHNCALLGREGVTLRLALDPRSAMMRTSNLEEKLAQALSRYYGSPIRLEIELREVTPETPARAAERNEAQLRSQAQVAFEADPVVENFKQRFGASVLSDSVRPLKSSE
jgi:DNA polymerase-3 subunit gamma/tau